MKEILNSKIKHREAYRPFAPICLGEDFSSFFDSSHLDHEFMTYAVKTKDSAKVAIPAVVHNDGTARVQIATEDCGIIYEILQCWKRKKGFGILINTSFNDNDEPIVLDELDAVSCFLRTNSDLLILNKKMLLRGSVYEQIEEILQKIGLEIQKRNDDRFRHSLSAILKSEAGHIQKYLTDYQIISRYHKNYLTLMKLHQLIIRILNKERNKARRLLVSEREVDRFKSVLNYFFCEQNSITEAVVVIPDSTYAIDLLLPGEPLNV
jgi:carbamoyltransferase